MGGVGWTGGWRAGWQVGNPIPVPIFLNSIENLQTYILGMHIWNQYETWWVEEGCELYNNHVTVT